ncbi:MAG TPA: hypothetical protein VGV91_20235 [Rubrobacter sp.]|nr:hypothetical protein [Rubrobacter sp.]
MDLTLASLREGVVGLGVEAALPEISAWEERLAASGDPGLETVAATLGQQVEGVAGAEIGAEVDEKLARLGALLGSEGDALTDKMTRV